MLVRSIFLLIVTVTHFKVTALLAIMIIFTEFGLYSVIIW
jgi:hypothetical protein